jgi:hypothetical protein
VLVAMESYGKRKDGLKLEGYRQVIGLLKTAGRPVPRKPSLATAPALQLQSFA